MLENLIVNLIYPTLAKTPMGYVISKRENLMYLASYPFFSFCYLYLHMSCDIISALRESQAHCPMSIFKKINLFIYLFLSVLGLRCCVRGFSSCGEQGKLFVAVHGLLIVVASLVVEHGL